MASPLRVLYLHEHVVAAVFRPVSCTTSMVSRRYCLVLASQTVSITSSDSLTRNEGRCGGLLDHCRLEKMESTKDNKRVPQIDASHRIHKFNIVVLHQSRTQAKVSVFRTCSKRHDQNRDVRKTSSSILQVSSRPVRSFFRLQDSFSTV
jgi:hypothetical protein